MQPQAIGTQSRSHEKLMAEIESGETYSGIKFKGLNRWVTEVLQAVLNSRQSIAKQKASPQGVQPLSWMSGQWLLLKRESVS